MLIYEILSLLQRKKPLKFSIEYSHGLFQSPDGVFTFYFDGPFLSGFRYSGHVVSFSTVDIVPVIILTNGSTLRLTKH